ncbi:hypothetical protein GCM10023162_31280 [Klenkia terrae]
MTVVAIGLATAACAGVEPSTTTAGSDSAAAADAATVISLRPADFATVLADDDVLVINVHVPDEGSIAGTDVAIPFDEVRRRSAELPQDLGAPLAVYCESGRMSAQAAADLRDLGYTDVVELHGGMGAWAAGGRVLLPAAG